MKVMYFLHEGGAAFNGSSRSILSVIRAGAAAGNTNYVVIPEAGGRLEDQLKSIENTHVLVQRSCRWKHFRRRRRLLQLYSTWRYRLAGRTWNTLAARRLARFAKTEGVELLHSNSSVIELGALVSRYSGIPHVWHVREFGEEGLNMYPYVPEKRFYRDMERYSAAIVCISDAIRKKLARFIDGKKLHRIYNGVSVPAELPKQRTADGVTKLLISGYLSENKGQRIAAEAITRLVREGITDLHLYIAGDGDPSVLGRGYDEVEDHVSLLGFVDDMAALRSDMDIELSCSVAEGFGRTVVEAMAAGLIVIGADSGATPELIENGATGLIFPTGDAAALAERIKEVRAFSEEERLAMRQRAFASVRETFGEKRYTAEVLRLYDKVITMGE